MATLLQLLLIFLVMALVFALVMHKRVRDAEQELKETSARNKAAEESKGREMAVSLVKIGDYRAVLSDAVGEFLRTGKKDGSHYQMWSSTLALIAKGGDSWINAVKERILSDHSELLTRHKEEELSISYDLTGRGDMSLPQYWLRTAKQDGFWTGDGKMVTKPEVVSALQDPNLAIFAVTNPTGKEAIGTAETVKAKLGL